MSFPLILKYVITQSNFQLVLPIHNGTIIAINWGDNTTTTNAVNYDTFKTHIYTNSGTYIVSVTGTGISELNYNKNLKSGATFLKECNSFGEIGLTNLSNAFFDCTSLTVVPSSLPINSLITNMSSMFNNAILFNQNISGWDVSKVTDMSNMFNGATAFNQDLSNWNVSKVTDMSNMFNGATAFNNGDNPLIWGEKTIKVQNMEAMFAYATSFNQDISSWNVSSVTNMSFMFVYATLFNQDLSDWNVSSVTNMVVMFGYATLFNQDLSDWDVSSVTDMGGVFAYATLFNQDLSSWDVSSVTDMPYMFYSATSFNQDLSSWDVSSVTDMPYMFYSATSFNQDLSSWDVSSVTTIEGMFDNCRLSISNYNKILNNWSLLNVQNNLNFGGNGMIYSPIGKVGHDTLSSKGWKFMDVEISSDIIYKDIAFTLTVNTDIAYTEDLNVFNISGNYILSSNNLFPSSSTINFNTNNRQPLVYSNLIFSSTGTNIVTLTRSSDNNIIATYQIDVYNLPTNVPCFKEDTKILTDNGYKCIQDLKIGDMVQTFKHGLKKINIIGKDKILHKVTNERIKDQLYIYSKEKYPELLEELIITGAHSILIDKFINDDQLNKTKKIIGNSCIIDEKYRLPACVDKDAQVYKEAGIYTIYHIALESNNLCRRYGIYANGLLVESCSKRYLKNRSNMILIN
jgi:surface protein